jgi:LPS export ABC transporter protein LptC
MNRARLTHPFVSAAFRRRHAALLLLALVLAAGCGERHELAPSGQSGALPDQEVEDFAITETDAGTVEWKLYAQQAAMFDVRNTITAHGVRVDFYDDKGKQSSRLTAREGEINQVSRDMTARGNVVILNSDGTRMSTQSLRFLNREQKIVSDELVRVEQKGNVLSGVGFESDPNLKHYQFRTQVTGTVRSRVETFLKPEKPEIGTGPK